MKNVTLKAGGEQDFFRRGKVLARVGLVTIETKTLPGHGLMKEIRAAAGIFRLEAMVM